MNKRVEDARILIVDDHEDNIVVLRWMLEDAGFNDIAATTNPMQVMEMFGAVRPDLVVTDLHMPDRSGLDVVTDIRATMGDAYLPVLILTADDSDEAKIRGLAAGATDFLAKPFNQTEVRLRIRNLLHSKLLYNTVQDQKAQLAQAVSERTQDLEHAKVEILERLALAAEFRDDDTGEHTERVGRVCGHIGKTLDLPVEQVEELRRAAPLHDVGKIGIPDRILLKRGKLTDPEWDEMKKHTIIGSRLLSGSISPTLRAAQAIALTHHERWNGTGYRGLKEEDIPLPGRIVAVADVFDALTHPRPYKDAWSTDQALAEICSGKGEAFDPRVVDAFMEVAQEVDPVDPPDLEGHESTLGLEQTETRRHIDLRDPRDELQLDGR